MIGAAELTKVNAIRAELGVFGLMVFFALSITQTENGLGFGFSIGALAAGIWLLVVSSVKPDDWIEGDDWPRKSIHTRACARLLGVGLMGVSLPDLISRLQNQLSEYSASPIVMIVGFVVSWVMAWLFLGAAHSKSRLPRSPACVQCGR
ncbi:hypothetical protein GCM10009650_12300 [Nesterenkonia jeotgali]